MGTLTSADKAVKSPSRPTSSTGDSMKGLQGWLIAFLAGVVLAGAAGVIRGDWLGRGAANEVHADLLHRLERTEDNLFKVMERMERKIDELGER